MRKNRRLVIFYYERPAVIPGKGPAVENNRRPAPSTSPLLGIRLPFGMWMRGAIPHPRHGCLGFHALTKRRVLMARNDLDKVLGHINGDRRSFFKTILIGTAL